jgi:hypothetical protein
MNPSKLPEIVLIIVLVFGDKTGAKFLGFMST